MTGEEIDKYISDLSRCKIAEQRKQKILKIVYDIPLDNTRIDDIINDIENLWVYGYDYLATGRNEAAIKAIIIKYKL